MEDFNSMIIDINVINSALDKISDLTSGDKSMPGLLLDIHDEDMDVCYSDGRKSIIDTIPIKTEDGDVKERIAVTYELFKNAINNCKPSGDIIVDNIKFVFHTDNSTFDIISDNKCKIGDGDDAQYKKISTKQFLIKYTNPEADNRMKVLLRAKYSEMFNPEANPDTLSKDELTNALSKTATEKGKQVYISKGKQTVFVVNQNFVTCVPIAPNEDGSNKLNYSMVIPQNIAKSIVNIANRVASDAWSLYNKDQNICVMFTETENERVGISFQMPSAQKTIVAALQRYESLKYDSYRMMFMRAFFVDAVKTAKASVENPNVEIDFENTDEGMKMVINGGNANASTKNKYEITCEDVLDNVGDLDGKKYTMSINNLSDVLNQFDAGDIVFDITDDPDAKMVYVRVADVDRDKLVEDFGKMREEMQQRCVDRGETFDPAATPTDKDLKTKWLRNCMTTKEYFIVNNKA